MESIFTKLPTKRRKSFFWLIFFFFQILILYFFYESRELSRHQPSASSLQRVKKELKIVSYPNISDKTVGNIVWKLQILPPPALLWKLPGKRQRSKSSTLTYLRRRNGKMKFETSQLILGQHRDKEPFSGFFAGLCKKKKNPHTRKKALSCSTNGKLICSNV